MTLFPGGRSRVRQMAKAILLSEMLRWRQENGRRKCQYKCVLILETRKDRKLCFTRLKQAEKVSVLFLG